MGGEKASAFDVVLGARLRTMRQMRGMSQSELGKCLGLSFQQVQKYETGANRIYPEKLYQCAQLFSVPIAYFFDAESDKNQAKTDKNKDDRLLLETARMLSEIPSAATQKRLRDLIAVLAKLNTS